MLEKGLLRDSKLYEWYKARERACLRSSGLNPDLIFAGITRLVLMFSVHMKEEKGLLRFLKNTKEVTFPIGKGFATDSSFFEIWIHFLHCLNVNYSGKNPKWEALYDAIGDKFIGLFKEIVFPDDTELQSVLMSRMLGYRYNDQSQQHTYLEHVSDSDYFFSEALIRSKDNNKPKSFDYHLIEPKSLGLYERWEIVSYIQEYKTYIFPNAISAIDYYLAKSS